MLHTNAKFYLLKALQHRNGLTLGPPALQAALLSRVGAVREAGRLSRLWIGVRLVPPLHRLAWASAGHCRLGGDTAPGPLYRLAPDVLEAIGALLPRSVQPRYTHTHTHTHLPPFATDLPRWCAADASNRPYCGGSLQS